MSSTEYVSATEILTLDLHVHDLSVRLLGIVLVVPLVEEPGLVNDDRVGDRVEVDALLPGIVVVKDPELQQKGDGEKSVHI